VLIDGKAISLELLEEGMVWFYSYPPYGISSQPCAKARGGKQCATLLPCTAKEKKLQVITEADRSVSTVLLPSEY